MTTKVKEWSHSQRVVASIGLGLLLFVVASALGGWAINSGPDGWFNYAPNNGVIFGGSVGVNWWEALTWAAAVGLWTAASLMLFRPTSASGGEGDPVDRGTSE
jgi:hypothetical protein